MLLCDMCACIYALFNFIHKRNIIYHIEWSYNELGTSKVVVDHINKARGRINGVFR